jgi:hypothetical protein
VEESGLSLVERIFENGRERWYPNMKIGQFSNGLNETDFCRACNSVTVNNGQLFSEEDMHFEFRRQVKERLAGTNLEQSLNVDKVMHRICHHGLTIEESYHRDSTLSWGKIRDDPFLFYVESHPATGVSADVGKQDLPLHTKLVNDAGVAVLVPNVYLHSYFNYFDLARYLLEAENRCELPITPALVYNIFAGLQLDVLPRRAGIRDGGGFDWEDDRAVRAKVIQQLSSANSPSSALIWGANFEKQEVALPRILPEVCCYEDVVGMKNKAFLYR